MTALLTGGQLPYFIFRLLLIIFLYAFFSVYRNEKDITNFFYISKQTATVGDKLEFGYKINNTGILPIFYAEINSNIASRLGNVDFPVEVSFLKPFQILNIRREIECRNKGTYHIGGLTVKIRDAFHLFERVVQLDNQIELEVYPRVIQIEKMCIPAAEFFGTVRVPNNTYEDYTSTADIRKYAQGDSIRKVHWKLSAKLSDLYVKNYELSANTRVNIFLDGYEKSYEEDSYGLVEGKAVEVAAAVIRYCLAKNLSTTLVSEWEQKTTVEAKDISRFNLFLRELIRFTPNGKVPFEDFLKIESRILPWGATIIIIARKLSDGLFHSILSLKEKRFNMMVIFVDEKKQEDDEPMVDQEIVLRESKIPVYRIDLDSDIREILEGQVCRQS